MRMFRRSKGLTDSIELRAYVVPEEDEDYFCLQIDLLINGSIGVATPTDLTQLEMALTTDGEFFVWTCDCGTPGCAGRFKGIKIKHQGDCFSFEDLDDTQRPHFTFETSSVRSAFQAAIKQGARLAEAMKGQKLVSIPHQNSKFFNTLDASTLS